MKKLKHTVTLLLTVIVCAVLLTSCESKAKKETDKLAKSLSEFDSSIAKEKTGCVPSKNIRCFDGMPMPKPGAWGKHWDTPSQQAHQKP